MCLRYFPSKNRNSNKLFNITESFLESFHMVLQNVTITVASKAIYKGKYFTNLLHVTLNELLLPRRLCTREFGVDVALMAMRVFEIFNFKLRCIFWYSLLGYNIYSMGNLFKLIRNKSSRYWYWCMYIFKQHKVCIISSLNFPQNSHV